MAAEYDRDVREFAELARALVGEVDTHTAADRVAR
jgi:hypothetical protein